ncbi:MAG: hypothetical protein V2J12_07655 [Gammaproteobacteria bacterium]|jgi:ElaB/YqjD/DUF883 family membrane-anchored ribosome-binding protein|nr:hypothetical protein [Gammaproteobacteria bacterium]
MSSASTEKALSDAELEQRRRSASQRLAGVAHDKIDKAAELGTVAENSIHDATEKATEKAQAASARAEDAADEAVAKAKSTIESNPLLAAGTAFAIGFVLSSLLRR